MAKSPYVHEKLPDDDVLRDGEKRTVPMMMRDEVIFVGLADGASLHRPGQRFSVDAAARARVEQARAEGIRDMCDAWKTPPTAEFRGQQPGDMNAAKWSTISKMLGASRLRRHDPLSPGRLPTCRTP